jgi:L,D-transpeptidase catalytic domain/Putative peptidoglycan binding domain
MGAAGARTAAVVASVALVAFVASGCEPISTVGMPPSVGQKGSKSNAKPKPSRTNKAWTIKPAGLMQDGSNGKKLRLFQPQQARLRPGPAIMKRGSSGERVRDLQARLKQIGRFKAPITGRYGSTTAQSVKGFQAKRHIPVTGEVDQRTLDRLQAATRTPSSTELHAATHSRGLDPRCMTGRVICISKRTRSLVWVVDGQPKLRMDVRFGSYKTPTREGSFAVTSKSRNQVSSIYHTPMPYSMFFSGGQAIHYSADFAARGYNGASYGCVNVRNRSGIKRLYHQAQLGDRVIVYR